MAPIQSYQTVVVVVEVLLYFRFSTEILSRLPYLTLHEIHENINMHTCNTRMLKIARYREDRNYSAGLVYLSFRWRAIHTLGLI